MPRLAGSYGAVTLLRARLISLKISQKALAADTLGRSASNLSGKICGRINLCEVHAFALARVVGESVSTLFVQHYDRFGRRRYRARRLDNLN